MATTTPDQDRACEALIAQHDSLAVNPPEAEGHPVRVVAFDGPVRTRVYDLRADGSVIRVEKIGVAR